MGKRLIVACDGTWQSADTGAPQDPTNVTNLCRALSYNVPGKNAIEQIVLYQPGVGTGNLTTLQHLLYGMYTLNYFQKYYDVWGIFFKSRTYLY